MKAILKKSIQDLLYNLSGAYLINIVCSVTTIQKGHHLIPINDCSFFLEELPSQIFFPILKAFELIGKHL
jgi:hypothetical protein